LRLVWRSDCNPRGNWKTMAVREGHGLAPPAGARLRHCSPALLDPLKQAAMKVSAKDSCPQRAGRPSASARNTLTRVPSCTRGRKQRWQVSRAELCLSSIRPTGLRYTESVARLPPLGGCRATVAPAVGVARSAGAVSASHGGIAEFQTSRCACKFNSAHLPSSVRIWEAGSEVLVTRDVIWTLLHLRQF
jgi:hypothetical protein